MPTFEIECSYTGLVGGVDEVGCGCLAGPVIAAAVIFLNPSSLSSSLLNAIKDSKQLCKSRREAIYQELIKLEAIAYGIGSASVEEIDRLNIRGAAFQAMARAVKQLAPQPQTLLIDGNQIPSFLGIQAIPVIKGDDLSYSIAAASIIAKVTRDKLMQTLAGEYPVYGWQDNVGYSTKEHKKALKIHGLTPHHRRSYTPVRECQDVQPYVYVRQALMRQKGLSPCPPDPLSFFDNLLDDYPELLNDSHEEVKKLLSKPLN